MFSPPLKLLQLLLPAYILAFATTTWYFLFGDVILTIVWALITAGILLAVRVANEVSEN